MSAQQTEAQRLAVWLNRRPNIMPQDRQAAAELLWLEAENAELLDALISIAEDSSDEGARACAMEAIEKHGGKA